jgi:hypothetical protein
MGAADTTAKPADTEPVEHAHTDVHGFDITATTHNKPGYWQGDLVWVGCGPEGRWLSVAEALELADAITRAAKAFPAQQAAEVAL